ncbi:MAG: RhuM family protein [Gammaproteobacteria bacterium]
MNTQKSQNPAIRNSAAEFMILMQQAEQDGIEARHQDGSVWFTQKLMAELFGVSVSTIDGHLEDIFSINELQPDSVTRKFPMPATGGKSHDTSFYNLNAIISVGYRVKSKRATQFRQWAGTILRGAAIKGYTLDTERLKNNGFLGQHYFDYLIENIQEIRRSDRLFYQKLTDLYATSMDYNKDALTTREFYNKVQNELHQAIFGHTTYRTPEERECLNDIVNDYMDMAEDYALHHIPMTMEDWATRLDKFLEFYKQGVPQDDNCISTEIAAGHTESEFEKYHSLAGVNA